jgi:hypothetical protein
LIRGLGPSHSQNVSAEFIRIRILARVSRFIDLVDADIRHGARGIGIADLSSPLNAIVAAFVKNLASYRFVVTTDHRDHGSYLPTQVCITGTLPSEPPFAACGQGGQEKSISRFGLIQQEAAMGQALAMETGSGGAESIPSPPQRMSCPAAQILDPSRSDPTTQTHIVTQLAPSRANGRSVKGPMTETPGLQYCIVRCSTCSLTH